MFVGDQCVFVVSYGCVFAVCAADGLQCLNPREVMVFVGDQCVFVVSYGCVFAVCAADGLQC